MIKYMIYNGEVVEVNVVERKVTMKQLVATATNGGFGNWPVPEKDLFDTPEEAGEMLNG